MTEEKRKAEVGGWFASDEVHYQVVSVGTDAAELSDGTTMTLNPDGTPYFGWVAVDSDCAVVR